MVWGVSLNFYQHQLESKQCKQAVPYSGYFAAKGKKNPKGKSCTEYKTCTVFRECWSRMQSAKSTLKEDVSIDHHRRAEHIPFTERGQPAFLPHRQDFTAQWRVQKLPPLQGLAWHLPALGFHWGGSRVAPVKKRGARLAPAALLDSWWPRWTGKCLSAATG